MAAPAALSPLAPKKYPNLPPIAGVRFATIAAGVRYEGRTDVMMAVFDQPAEVAGVFTRSKCPSAPVDWCRDKLKGGKARALIVNSGNANAFTGGLGASAVAHVGAALSKAIGAQPRVLAAAPATSWTASIPLWPVKAFALPELTISARALPPGSC